MQQVEIYLTLVKKEFREYKVNEVLSITLHLEEFNNKNNTLQDRINSLPTYLAISKKAFSLTKIIVNKGKSWCWGSKGCIWSRICCGAEFGFTIHENKKWLRKSIFKSGEILKQMDLFGDGYLKHEGMSALNDIESSAYQGDEKRIWGRLLCISICLQRAAHMLENDGDKYIHSNQYTIQWGSWQAAKEQSM
jgi:hypothetical protein